MVTHNSLVVNTQLTGGNTQLTDGNTQLTGGNTQLTDGNTQLTDGNTDQWLGRLLDRCVLSGEGHTPVTMATMMHRVTVPFLPP